MKSKAIFARGCFWGVEDTFRKVPGVLDVTVGYTGGDVQNPTYEQVCSGGTGHAEAVEVIFDPKELSYQDLLETFWKSHDPTTLETKRQYRSAIFYLNEEQRKLAEESKQEQAGQIVTEIVKAGPFYKAEEYHQQYFKKKGIDPTCHI